MYAGFVDAESEEPAPAQEVVRPEVPDLGEGPHLFYGLQWWFFGLLAVFGFGYLAWDELRHGRRDEWTRRRRTAASEDNDEDSPLPGTVPPGTARETVRR